MAHLELTGLDTLINDLGALAELPDSVADGILDAEADVIVRAQREEIGRRWKGPYSLGISAESIEKGKVKKGRTGRSVTVSPQGERRRGGKSIRNGEIAFLNEYGVPGRKIAARPAIAAANAKAEQEAAEAGERVYHDWLDSKGL